MRSSCLLRIVRSFGSSKVLLTPKFGILMMNSSLFWSSKRKQKIIGNMKHTFEFSTISGGGCGGQHMDAKSILTIVSQISASRHHLHTLFVAHLPIFDRETANRSCAYHYETPCRTSTSLILWPLCIQIGSAPFGRVSLCNGSSIKVTKSQNSKPFYEIIKQMPK